MKLSIFKQHKSRTDQELLSLYMQDKNTEVLGILYHRYLDMMTGLCLKYLKNVPDAEDAVMEIFEVIVRRLPNHTVENFKSWIYKVGSNHCLDILRKQKRISEKEIEHYRMQSEESKRHSNAYMIEELDPQEVKLQIMEDCIDTLDNKQQRAIRMFYLQKKSYDDVAEALEITWSQTRSYIQNGRRNLKNCMEKKHERAR